VAWKEVTSKKPPLTIFDLHESFNISRQNTDGCDLYIAVDTACSDEQLVEEFKNALDTFRSTINLNARRKDFTAKDFARWHRYAVLPYIDLTLWAQFHGARIAHHVLGDVLFPNEDFDRAQAIRQTVKPLAKTLMQLETLQTLRAQGRKEKKDKK
jgi:hypothetical protein